MATERLSELPDRALEMSEAKMEFAYGDGTAIYLVTYTPRAGAPKDLTKQEFDRALAVMNLAGETISPPMAPDTHTVLYRINNGTQTDPADTPANQILAEVLRLVGLAQQWMPVIQAAPLHEQLAPTGADQ